MANMINAFRPQRNGTQGAGRNHRRYHQAPCQDDHFGVKAHRATLSSRPFPVGVKKRMKQEDIPFFLKDLLQDLPEDLSPGRIFGERLKVEGETLRIEGRTFTGPFYLLALGKAAWDSAAALARRSGAGSLGADRSRDSRETLAKDLQPV